MKYCYLFIILIFCAQEFKSQTTSDFSYESSLNQKSIVAAIQQYYGEKTMSKQDWKTLDSLSSLVILPYLRYDINVVYFSIYDKTGPMEKGAEYFKKIVLQGCLYDGVANKKYADFYDYDSLIEVKNAMIDSNLLNFFNRLDRKVIVFDSNGLPIFKLSDSVFVDELDSLVHQYGKWPGFKERGFVHQYKGKNFYPTVLTKLLTEKKAYYYYNLVEKECKQGNENWSIAINIATQIVATSRYENRFFKIRDLVFEKKYSLYEGGFNSFYTLGIKFHIRRNTWAENKINIYPTELWGGSDYYPKLTQLVDMLVESGIPYESIQIKNEIIQLDKNESIANDYYFVYDISKK